MEEPKKNDETAANRKQKELDGSDADTLIEPLDGLDFEIPSEGEEGSDEIEETD